MYQLPRTQAEVFDEAARRLAGQSAAASSAPTRHQRFQIQLALATEAEDPETHTELLTILLQTIYKQVLAQVYQLPFTCGMYVILQWIRAQYASLSALANVPPPPTPPQASLYAICTLSWI